MEKSVEIKAKKWPVKEMVLTFLAISKVGAWIDKISQFAENDYENMWLLILNRILSRDIWIVVGVIVYFVLDKYKINDLLKSIILYFVILFGLNVFYWVYIGAIVFNLIWIMNFTVMYVIMTAVLYVKDYLKNKGKEKS